jgi:hypothetical protein
MYQDWAAFPGKEPLYEKAMVGAEPTQDAKSENIIWGWGKLSQVTAQYPNYHNVFHQARYNLALCRFKRWPRDEEQLKKARDAILLTQKLYGNGEHWAAWRPKQDALLKQIQSALGQPAVGLPEDTEIAQSN